MVRLQYKKTVYASEKDALPGYVCVFGYAPLVDAPLVVRRYIAASACVYTLLAGYSTRELYIKTSKVWETVRSVLI